MPEEKLKFHHRLQHQLKRVPHHTKHFFIPHTGNNHQPHALRPVALKIYSVAVIAVKLFVTTFLFVTYPSAGHFAAITESEILQLTNASRQEAGISTLKANEVLNKAARLKAQDMIEDNYFAHTAPDGTKPWEFLKRAGYSYSAAGENLAMDFTEAASVNTAFMNSASHKKNILNGKYTEMGIAVVEGELEGHTTTILVEFFGTPYSTTVASQPDTTSKPATNTNTATNKNTNTATKPVTKPVVKPVTKPTPQYYQAQLTDQSAKDLNIKTLERISFWVGFKNTGTTTWTNSGQYFVALNVANPAGRQSAFQDESWISYYRPAVLKQNQVTPGNVGRFEFTLKAPKEAGVYEESFSLVAEDLTWISGGSIELPIVVVAPPEQTTETQVQVIPAPATATPTNTNVNTAPPATEEKPLASDQNVNAVVPIVKSETIDIESHSWPARIAEFAQKFYAIIIIFITIALLINVLVEIRIQHPHLIAQTLLVIIIAITALVVQTHFLERIPEALKII